MNGEIHQKTHHVSLWGRRKHREKGQLGSVCLVTFTEESKGNYMVFCGNGTFVEWGRALLNDTGIRFM